MKETFKEIARAGVIALLGFATIASATTLNFVQTPTATLYSSISTTATSMRITPYPRDLDNVKLTITDFGSNPTLTVDPKVKLIEEIIGFTGITDNGDNTATLTGLSRDLTSKSPYTTTGTGRQHGAGAIVVFSNNPQMYARFATLENNQTITGLTTFNISPIINDVNSTSSLQAASRGYAAGLAFNGVASSSESQFGGVWLGTAIQQASSTNGLPNKPYVTQTKYSTSTPLTGCDGTSVSGALCSVVAENNGKINKNFISTTTAYNWSANDTYSGQNSFTATTTFATTTRNGADFGGNIVNIFTGGETINGYTVPQPVMMATTTNRVYLVDGDVASTTSFIGFVLNNCGNGTPCYVQTDGIVGGFSALVNGSDYFVSDTAGVLASTPGTSENYVGRAVSSTQILIQKGRDMQYLGSQTLGCTNATPVVTVVNQPFARFASINATANGGGSTSFNNEFFISKFGKVTGSWSEGVVSSSAGAVSATWNSNGSISVTSTSNSCTNATAYYYR